VRLITVLGARPQFIKALPLSRALHGHHEEMIAHTGQHYDDEMSGVFFRELALPSPRWNLGVGSASHAAQTAAMLAGLEPILSEQRPDAVIVFGDTNTTLAAALAASKLHVPIVHVEAGVRSRDRRMPEEVNRVVADHLAALCCCPTASAVDNLAMEGISKESVLTGDVLCDAVRLVGPSATRSSRVLTTLGLPRGGYAMATLHRPENVDDPGRLSGLVQALMRLPEPVVLPLHPRTRQRLEGTDLLVRLTGCTQVIAPLPYADMLALTASAGLVVTDSGGLQREAYLLDVPCVVVRPCTEWPELVAAGASVLAPTPADLEPAASVARAFGRRAIPSGLLGDGNASLRICEAIDAMWRGRA
jgi:UDP-N-acetylglucosamine 2-epimerase